MRFLPFFLLLFQTAIGQTKADRDALVGALFEAADIPSFEKAYTAAQSAKIPDQILVEARFLHLVDHADRATLAAFAPTLKTQLEKNEMKDSLIFAVKEDFMAVHQYTLALGALEKKDEASFKKHITEAFWLSPSQAAVFAPHIDDYRLSQKMADLKIDFNQKLELQLEKDQSIALQTVLGKSPALVLHFWNPWSQESINSMDDFFATADLLQKNEISVASVLITGSEASKTDADAFLTELPKPLKGKWLIETKDNEMSRLLRISNFPTVVLIAKDGSILFNGNPGAPEFWHELKILSPKIARPKSQDANLPSQKEVDTRQNKDEK